MSAGNFFAIITKAFTSRTESNEYAESDEIWRDK